MGELETVDACSRTRGARRRGLAVTMAAAAMLLTSCSPETQREQPVPAASGTSIAESTTTTATAMTTAMTSVTATTTTARSSADESLPPSSSLPTLPASAFGPYPVVSITDGDTIRVDIDGVEEKVRLIGIDTPELNPLECFGQESTAFATSLLQGQSVALQADSSQDDRDRYGRLLRYVFLTDGTNVNGALISDGYGFEYTYDKPYLHRDEFIADELAARSAGAGLWSPTTCNGRPTSTVTNAPPASSPITSAAPQDVPAGCPIKGNINSKGEKIYHQPGDPSYDDTRITESKGEKYFCSVEEAQAEGWRPPRN